MKKKTYLITPQCDKLSMIHMERKDTLEEAKVRARNIIAGLKVLLPTGVFSCKIDEVKVGEGVALQTWTIDSTDIDFMDIPSFVKHDYVGNVWTRPERIMTLQPHSDIIDHMSGLEDYISTDESSSIVKVYYPETIREQSVDKEVNETVRYRLEKLYELCKDCKFVIIAD